MKLLVLGGTVFLSEAVAAEGVRRGHEVTCACRGESGPVPAGARLVRWDRSAGDPAPAELGSPDAVVDVARHPSWVRTAVAALPDAHWVFVSTVNVYADNATPGGRPGTIELVEAITTDEDPAPGSEVYGAMKVGCEQLVTDGAASSALIRPGPIAGPGDPSGRFTYWPLRLAEGGENLAGGAPTDIVQLIDVRDLASWIVTAAERRTTGVFDGVGPAMPVGDLLAETARGVDSNARLTWVPDDALTQQDVEPWSGENALPLWLPRPEYDGMLSHDVAPTYAAGLTTRPIADTARDTLAWARAHPDVARTGLSCEHEARVLTAWRDQQE
ncbi:SDR family oxidoreductase [soil metagenome]